MDGAERFHEEIQKIQSSSKKKHELQNATIPLHGRAKSLKTVFYDMKSMRLGAACHLRIILSNCIANGQFRMHTYIYAYDEEQKRRRIRKAILNSKSTWKTKS